MMNGAAAQAGEQRQTEISIGRKGDFPLGASKVVTVRKRPVAVFRLGEDEFEAFLNSCPHKGAPIGMGALSGTLLPSKPGELVYGMDRTIVRCPWHGYEFDVHSGECVFTGTNLKLRKFPVTVKDDEVFIRLA